MGDVQVGTSGTVITGRSGEWPPLGGASGQGEQLRGGTGAYRATRSSCSESIRIEADLVRQPAGDDRAE